MEDAPKVSRPKKCTPEVEEAVIKTISKNLTTRELSTQKKIQEWIERIPEHIQKIIKLEGGNKYKEGRNKRKRNPNRVR